ncbi:hypothetical protein CORC01_06284 [Colletotrichum orchidophilum]|uniref:Infection structure specific protein n=1 Tax=Colletotrichum orchidophilum TaxID=1209926 RepID=A0A1G4BAR7_9PEZI|nr:uncharacterized protein CORC01_06284 [Colletotrichum orchidophilum]OHE98493.1 hypothetical protein CORC01_06284 [Colletotrichum orchidophilum]
MRVATVILGALAATAAAAGDVHLKLNKRIEPTKIIQVLEARGTPECTNALKAFVDAVTGSDPLPTPPADLEEWAATAAIANSAVDPCSTVSVTDSMSAVYTSWSNALMSWQTAHMSEMRNAWHECTDIPIISAEVKGLLASGGYCSSRLAALTSEATGAEATEAKATGAAATGAATTASQNAGPKETGIAVAAVAAAGFVFAAMQ